MQLPKLDSVSALISEDQRNIWMGAAFGVLIFLLGGGEGMTLRKIALAIVAGLVLANYGVAFVAHLLNWGPGVYGMLGLGFGIVAFSMVSGVFTLLRLWRENPGEVLRNLAQYIPFLKKGGTP